MYYPCSENKDADQLRGYREADLRLCFRPCKLLVFLSSGSFGILFTPFLVMRAYMAHMSGTCTSLRMRNPTI